MNFRTVVSLFLLFVLVASIVPAAQKQAASDDTIYDNVRRRLTNDPDVKGGTIQVEVKEGVVTLRGRVDQQKQKEKAEKLTKKVRGVKRVDNQLTVVRKGTP